MQRSTSFPRRRSITNQPAPASQSVGCGGTATFTVVAGGGQPMGYTWHSIIGGVTNTVGSGVTSGPTNTLTLASVQANQAGSYFVTIANSCGSTNSALATLVVTNQRRFPPRSAPAVGCRASGFQFGFTNTPGGCLQRGGCHESGLAP